MKKFIISLCLLGGSLIGPVHATETNTATRPVHHVVVVWLKQPGNLQARQQYIAASKKLAQLPGVAAYHIGTPLDLHRTHPSPGKDDSYDIAITSRFANPAALEKYLSSPEHRAIIQNELKPLVDHYTTYDFVE